MTSSRENPGGLALSLVPLAKIQEEFQLPKYKNWRNYDDRFKTHIMVMYQEITGETKKFYDIK